MSLDSKISTTSVADRTNYWLLVVMLALTLAMGLQTLWWIDQPRVHMDRHSMWSMLHAVATADGYAEQARRPLMLGAMLVGLATAGLLLRLTLALALALPSSTAIISLALLCRYIALFEEPRQYHARSPYVETITCAALIMVVSHGVAALLGLRLLRNAPASVTGPPRLALAILGLVVATVPMLWLRVGGQGGAIALIACACIAGALAALALAARPTGAMSRITLATTAAALLAQVIGLALLLGQRPHRQALYSEAAERGLLLLSIAVPSLLAIAALAELLRRRARQAAAAEVTATAADTATAATP